MPMSRAHDVVSGMPTRWRDRSSAGSIYGTFSAKARVVAGTDLPAPESGYYTAWENTECSLAMSSKPQLVVVNNFHPETVARLDALYDTTHLWEVPDAEKAAVLVALDGKCEVAASASWFCDDQIYTLPSLKLLACFGVGVDAIDFDTTGRNGIAVTNTPDVLNDAVADLALALILATARNLVSADRFVRAGQWPEGPFPFGQSLAGKTLGIIGLGRIGEAIVQRALPFKLNIAYHNRSPKAVPYTYYASIHELAASSDFLLNMLPGGEATAKLIDAAVFEQLGSEGIFLNVGRGTSVDETALIEALQTGRIAGAGLDVYANEPQVPAALREMENVVLMPHIGSATVQTRRAMGQLVLDNLAAWLAGKPLLTKVNHK